MNDPHKFGTEFGSDHALEQSTPIVNHHDTIKWFEAIPGEQLCIRVHGTQVNGRYGIMENSAASLPESSWLLPVPSANSAPQSWWQETFPEEQRHFRWKYLKQCNSGTTPARIAFSL